MISVITTLAPTQPGHISEGPYRPTTKRPVTPCFEGMDVSACPKEGCEDGFYCDGLKCVRKGECPCMVDGKVIRVGNLYNPCLPYRFSLPLPVVRIFL